MVIASFFLAHWISFFYAFPLGAVWGNVFVIFVLVPLGWVWTRTKFWPLKPIEKGVSLLHKKVDKSIAHHESHAEQLQNHSDKIDHLLSRIEELHDKIDNNG